MDLSFLTSIRGTTGPVSSVIVNASRDAEDTDHAVRVRWSKARADLSSQGADEETLAAMDSVVGDTHGVPGQHGHVVYAADGTVLAQAVVTEFPQDYRARVGPLPDPLLYVYSESPRVPYVLAVVDTLGADLWTVHADGRATTQRVEGEDWPVHKVREGGYHHNQMQRTVDNRVADNAGRVAGAIAQTLRGTEADIVAIAGEIAVRGEVRARLPDWAEPKAVDLEAGSRPTGSSTTPLNDELRGILAGIAQRELDEAIAEFEQGRANRERTTEGLASVVHALQRGQVRTLLWSTARRDTETWLWFGPSAEQLALTSQEVRDMGVQDPVAEYAAPVLLRAAAAGSAELLLVPQHRTTTANAGTEPVELTDGIGALLRFDDPTMTS
ncbi:Vms1/Ankzf1 family peptidyl-tRNA hydrolase [Lipingzhangella sp. LS1_29]|uniref:Vms1/Ankzf1 family peptidyl-tRNA hydrolase n=1 Tax=Lipingzhangella rawalii TaxID=2055835 RepID=A0ABU2HAW4_9ACTN|nr:Vms1/Ankzf1 family peptidyl-tRNA hydrolase [Lipingzhangella rawalii]MDS1272416.1 Vms1/Ankzf1 family peptidyl-tRNA hydrolase [Lipingzhangella rawalii]